MTLAAAIVAVDPGPARSACVLFDVSDGTPADWAHEPNDRLLARLDRWAGGVGRLLVVERVESYGMPVGVEVFETCRWEGRFIERWRCAPGSRGEVLQVGRRAVKVHLCGSARARDSNVRQALVDRFGGRQAAVGRKATPGPLYGLTGDCWAALAVAVWAADTLGAGVRPLQDARCCSVCDLPAAGGVCLVCEPHVGSRDSDAWERP